MDRLLTQAEADFLLSVEKHCRVHEALSFPSPGEKLVIPLESFDGREKFLLDLNRGRIKLAQCTYQERTRSTIILVRLDVEGPEHTNPDGETIPCPHIHIYREGFGDKWAMPLPDTFQSPGDLMSTLHDFYHYCNITQWPPLQGVLL